LDHLRPGTLLDRLAGRILVDAKVHGELESPEHRCHLRNKALRSMISVNFAHHVGELHTELLENLLVVFPDERRIFLSQDVGDTIVSPSQSLVEVSVALLIVSDVLFLLRVGLLWEEGNLTDQGEYRLDHIVRDVRTIFKANLADHPESALPQSFVVCCSEGDQSILVKREGHLLNLSFQLG